MARLGSEQLTLAPVSDGKSPEAVSLAPADDRLGGERRANWLLPLALFPPFAPNGSGRKGRAEQADKQRGRT
jgi:hypothetical protein